MDGLKRSASGRLSAKKFIPGIAWFFIVLFLLCLPGQDIPSTNAFLERIFFDKWVHAGVFGLLAALFMAPVFASGLSLKRKQIYTIAILILIIFWGLATEFIQEAFVEGRTSDMFDWMSDSLGATLGYFFTRHFFLTRHNNINGAGSR
jgi:VanZ family protein